MLEIIEIINNCSSPDLGAVLYGIKKIIGMIQIIVPILLMISLLINFTKLLKDPDNSKLKSTIKNSFIATVIVFFVPIFINVLMNILGENFTVSDCWNKVQDFKSSTSYASDGTDDKKKPIIPNEDDYERGNKKSPSSSSSSSSSGYDQIEGTAQQIGDAVWDPSNVTKISNLTSTQLIGVLNAAGGNATNFIPYAQQLITSEHKYNVNVFFLLGVEALESGWVTSDITRACNNLGGVCESSSRPSRGCGSNSNCAFAYFNSINEFIDYHASFLHSSYLTPGATYYEGLSPSHVVIHYCPGCSTWPRDVVSIGNSLFSKVSSVL